MDCQHWFGQPPDGCDVPNWIPYLDAETIGTDATRKITIPMPSALVRGPKPANSLRSFEMPDHDRLDCSLRDASS